MTTREDVAVVGERTLSDSSYLALASSRASDRQYIHIWTAMTAFNAAAETKPHHSVASPVSVAVVKTRARQPARLRCQPDRVAPTHELNTRNADS